jgi:hypothetical protein
MSKSPDAIDIGEAAFKLGIVNVVVYAIMTLIWVWPVMLALGILHHQWAVVPAFGYWPTYALALGLGYLVKALK